MNQKTTGFLTDGIILANAFVFLLFGPLFVFWPTRFAAFVEIELNTATAFADFRAMYGGLPFGVGILFVASLFRKEWKRPSLLVIACTSAGLLLSRTYSILFGPSDVSSLIHLFMAMEAASAAVAGGLYLRGAK